jgi:SAM-dependent methyltransferase
MNTKRLYHYRFRDIDQDLRQEVWNAIAPYIFNELGSPTRLLEPAAGRCEFINAVPATERWAVDLVDHPESRLDPNTNLIVSDIFDAELPSDYFDGIFVSNFLEHLNNQDEVADFLEKMWGCIRPGGRIVIIGPNFRHLGSVYYDFADHKVALSHRAVEEHLYGAGFEPIRSVSRFLPYNFRSVHGRLPVSGFLTKLYLKLPPLWRMFGGQFLVVGMRPPREETVSEIAAHETPAQQAGS